MKIVKIVVLLLVTFGISAMGETIPPETPPEMFSVTDVYKEMVTATNMAELRVAAEKVNNEMRKVDRHLLFGRLLRNMESRSVVLFEASAGDLHHDISIEGGRCAWMLEELLNCRLPNVTRKSSSEQLAQSRGVALRKMQTVMKGETITTDTSGISRDQRISMAENTTTEKAILASLSTDKDVSVRAAVARNTQTPVTVLTKMIRNDSAPHVRQLAIKNLEVSRTIP